MIRKCSLIFAYVIGASANRDAQVFQNLNILLDNAEKPMHVHIQNLDFISNELNDGIKKLTWLQQKDEGIDVKGGIKIAEEALGMVAGAIQYVGKATDDAADVKRVEEVLAFVRQEKVILVRYTGDMLTESITVLNQSANKMYKSMQKVKSLAKGVKNKAVDIRDWTESFDELGTKVDSDIKETWKVILLDWQTTLKVAKAGTEEVRDELNAAIDTILDMRSKVEGMAARAELKANEHMDELQKEYQAAQDAVADMQGCNVLEAIFTLGIACLIKHQAKRKAERTRARVEQQSKELEQTLKPLIVKINSIQDVADGLLAAGYFHLENVNDFLDALTDAESYFDNGGKLFHTPARRKHVAKLNTLIEACDVMETTSNQKMGVFKAVILGGNVMVEEVPSIDGAVYEKQVEAETNAWLEDMKAQKKAAGMDNLQNLVIERGIANVNMDDNQVFLM